MIYSQVKAKREKAVIDAAINLFHAFTLAEIDIAIDALNAATEALILGEPKRVLAHMTTWIYDSCTDPESRKALEEAQRGAVIFPDACASAACFCMNTGDNAKAWAYAIAYVLLKGES